MKVIGWQPMRVGLMIVISLLLALGCRPVVEDPQMPVAETTAPPGPPVESTSAIPVALAPAQVVDAFYQWYLAYNDPEAGRNALVDHAFRQSEYLSARLVQAVDADLAHMAEEYGGASADPFLLAQALPQLVEAEEWEQSDAQACVILHQYFGERVRDLTVDLVTEGDNWKIDRIRTGSPLTPEGVTELFLTDYLTQARLALEEGEAGTWQSGAYRESALLSPEFVGKVDGLKAGSGESAYDPFLCAQDLPHAINVGEAVVTGDAATIMVGRYYAGTPQPTYMTVELTRQDGRWQIADIRPVFEPAAEDMAPEAVVESFYAGWLGAADAARAGECRNPLASGSYRDSPYVDPTFAAALDELTAGSAAAGRDPFLCAQEIPDNLSVAGTVYTLSGARVPVQSGFSGHAFVVELVKDEEDNWQIAGVVCPGTPEENALIFYTWYLAYTRDCCLLGATDPGMRRSSLVDGAYREAPFLHPSFAAEIEKAIGTGGNIKQDPFIPFQASPPDFSILAGSGEGMVIVNLDYVVPERLAVQMEAVNGQWLIRAVTRLEPAVVPTPAAAGPDTSDWVTIADLEHGFSFKIPPDWVAQPQDLKGPGMPDDWPVLQQYLLMPATVAEELTAQSGPPAGDEILPVPPLNVSYLYGEQAAFDRVFVPAAAEVTLEMNGKRVLAQRQEGEYALPRYVYRDPQDPRRWVIVEDLVNEFPGREVQAAETVGVLDGILLTLSLER